MGNEEFLQGKKVLTKVGIIDNKHNLDNVNEENIKYRVYVTQNVQDTYISFDIFYFDSFFFYRK